MEWSFEGAFGLVGLSSALYITVSALSAGAAFQGVQVTVPSLPLMLTSGMVLA